MNPEETAIELLMTKVALHWTFDERAYPALMKSARSPADHREFALRHVLLHLQKQVGVFATVAEAADHGMHPSQKNLDDLTLATKKLFVNVLQLANLLKISPRELLCYMEQWEASAS